MHGNTTNDIAADILRLHNYITISYSYTNNVVEFYVVLPLTCAITPLASMECLSSLYNIVRYQFIAAYYYHNVRWWYKITLVLALIETPIYDNKHTQI